ncbi:MAG: HEAT repeat domain-containing protein [Candidatus Muiribacteriota bacterium]
MGPEKIFKILPECDSARKKVIFEKIINAKDMSLYDKRDFVKKILVKVQDEETQALARYVYHTIKEKIEKEEDYFRNNPEDILSSDNNDDKIELLKKIRTNKMIELKSYIMKYISKEKDPFVLATMISTIGEVGTPEDGMGLLEFLASSDSRIRANAVDALSKLENEKTYDQIIVLVEDPDSRVRANVAHFLKEKGTYRTMEILKKMVYSGDVRELESAIYVLKRIDRKKSGNLLKLAQEKLEKNKRNDFYSGIKNQIKEKTGTIKPEFNSVKDKILNIFKKKN